MLLLHCLDTSPGGIEGFVTYKCKVLIMLVQKQEMEEAARLLDVGLGFNFKVGLLYIYGYSELLK